MSLPIFCQGLVGTSWCSNGSADLDGKNSVQALHLFTVVSMSLFMPGQIHFVGHTFCTFQYHSGQHKSFVKYLPEDF